MIGIMASLFRKQMKCKKFYILVPNEYLKDDLDLLLVNYLECPPAGNAEDDMLIEVLTHN